MRNRMKITYIFLIGIHSMTMWITEGKLISRYMTENESPLPLLKEMHVDSILIKHLYSMAVSYNSQVTLTLSKIILVSVQE